jgi:hypothetical protein
LIEAIRLGRVLHVSTCEQPLARFTVRAASPDLGGATEGG